MEPKEILKKLTTWMDKNKKKIFFYPKERDNNLTLKWDINKKDSVIAWIRTDGFIVLYLSIKQIKTLNLNFDINLLLPKKINSAHMGSKISILDTSDESLSQYYLILEAIKNDLIKNGINREKPETSSSGTTRKGNGGKNPPVKVGLVDNRGCEEKYQIISDKCGYLFSDIKQRYNYNVVINRAVDGSTFRSFWLNKDENGHIIGESASILFRSYFIDNQVDIIKILNGISGIDELNDFENDICDHLNPLLLQNISNMTWGINSLIFNKTRKVVDLYIEHLIIMCNDFELITRNKLKEIVFLPLDGYIFAERCIFTDEELRQNGNLNRKSTYGDLKEERHYNKLQLILKDKAKMIRNTLFYRCYFDLFWRNRLDQQSEDLYVI
jgi:hypothetical protein